MSLLQLKNIFLKFNSFEVLKDVSFEVKDKEIVALVGPLGCGKTTLLKIIGGLIKPTAGEIVINNHILTKPTRKIAYVFQKSNLMPWRTVEQNITLALEIQSLDAKVIKQKVISMLQLIKLEKFRNFYPKHLSGGMEQLTALARAFISDAPILLLDEPFASLDSITREQMNLELIKLWQKRQKTIVLVTHNIEEAIWLSNKIIVFTSRPSQIIKTFKIDLLRPRGLEVYQKDRFKILYQKIRKNLTY